MIHDVRAIANFVLDLASQNERGITNMHINKIIFFLHADYLVTFSKPLVSAKIEAWEHGPVFRELYREFKSFGEKPITSRAKKIDPISGLKQDVSYAFSTDELEFLKQNALKYSKLSAAALRASSHVEGGPWDQAWNHDGISNASMKISDEQIQSWHERTPKH